MDTVQTEEKPSPEHVEEHVEHHDEQDAVAAATYDTVRESIRKYSEEAKINAIIEEILTRERQFKDDRDDSEHPSYTDFKVPYHMTCRLRYSRKQEEYEKQFQHEINEILNHQPTAYDAARFNRHLCITTLWPPLHNRKEIEYFQSHFFRLSHKQKKRLEFLMNTPITN